MSKPEELMQATKKGKTVMMFAKIHNFVSREETEEVTSIWQTGLYNNHIQVQQYQHRPIGPPSTPEALYETAKINSSFLGLRRSGSSSRMIG